MQIDARHRERGSLLAFALRVFYFSITWNGVVGTAALLVGVSTGSLALTAFALNALLDSTASVVLVLRFRRERTDPVAAEELEHRAQTWIVTGMYLVAVYVGVQAARALVNGAHPEPSALAFGIAAASLVVLPVLAALKLRLGKQLSSPALSGDGVLTVAAAGLAAVTLLALAANSLFDWWWADPVAAFVISVPLAVEATRVTVRHRLG